jgi:hypothetical protein
VLLTTNKLLGKKNNSYPDMGEFSGTPKPDPQDLKVRETIRQVIRASRKSRDQISAELAARLGRPVSKRMLDDFAAPSKDGSRFPAAWVAAFCEVTGDRTLQRLLVDPEIDAALRVIEFARETVRGSKPQA